LSELFTVFYSWQSDTNRRHGRDLIREALDIAADAVSKDTSNAYRIMVLSDTEGEPGLCNIPETLLRRLRESDAVVSDLTFIAGTSGKEPKYCSNPNVLFELGYAFSKIGPERLICVMNEAHGPAASQIFDLAHHRRPISYTSPKEDGIGTRKQTVEKLAAELEEALRGVLKLGLVGGSGGDDEIRHQRELSEIQSFHQSSEHKRLEYPRIEFVFRPAIFRPNRWPDAESLEALIREVRLIVDRYLYPPQQTGTAAMNWGIMNNSYRHPWALTYAGLFWTDMNIGERQPFTLSEYEMQTMREFEPSPEVAAGQWMYGEYALSQLSTAFQFVSRLTDLLADSEEVCLNVTFHNTKNKLLRFGHDDAIGPSMSPYLHRSVNKTAREFKEHWQDEFAAIGKAFTDLFNRDGRSISLDGIKRLGKLADGTD
tara:strand:- start:5664 stop:6944 length:1281 start_codon:yes stop_codon:yes gene_type:complete